MISSEPLMTKVEKQRQLKRSHIDIGDNIEFKYEQNARLLGSVDLAGTGVPFFKFLSAASLFALYSILFCSKFGSLRYSSKDLMSDTGAYLM
jgi:hypothetical protein